MDDTGGFGIASRPSGTVCIGRARRARRAVDGGSLQGVHDALDALAAFEADLTITDHQSWGVGSEVDVERCSVHDCSGGQEKVEIRLGNHVWKRYWQKLGWVFGSWSGVIVGRNLLGLISWLRRGGEECLLLKGEILGKKLKQKRPSNGKIRDYENKEKRDQLLDRSE